MQAAEELANDYRKITVEPLTGASFTDKTGRTPPQPFAHNVAQQSAKQDSNRTMRVMRQTWGHNARFPPRK